jgi:hypothetical protein
MLIAVLAMALLVGVVSAAVISYFGQVQMTATVKQAIRLDGQDYTPPITQTADVSGGESFCRYHWLTSQTSVPVNLKFETWGPDMGGITVKYYAMGTSTTWHIAPSGGDFDKVEAYVTKTDKAGSVEFKVEIVSDNPAGHTYGMGIAISTDRNTIDFQVFYKEWEQTYGWYYQKYPWTSSVVSLGDSGTGITATGDREHKVFTVDIPIGLLGGCGAQYYYAIQFRTNLIGTYPQGLNLWAQTDASRFAPAVVGTEITGSFTLTPGQVLPFYICYKFDPLIEAGTYDIYSTVKPA